MKTIAAIRRAVLVSVGGMLTVVGGCAGAPSMDTLSPAETAVNRAIEAKAEEYAPLELRQADCCPRLGEAYPVASNDTMAGRQQNRRVEIVVAEHPQQVGVSREP